MATDDRAAIAGAFAAIQGEADRDDLRHTVVQTPTATMTAAQVVQLAWDNAAFAADVAKSLGLIYAMATAGRALVEQEPAPQPPPTPQPPPVPMGYLGFAVTYATHGLAEDCYMGTSQDQKEWGPHHGLDILAPVDGTVEAYQFGVGGAMAALNHASPEERASAAALFEGWTCIAPAPAHAVSASLAMGQQTMYVAVFRPSVPLSTSGGPLQALWFGHVRQDIATGRVARGGRICTSFDSGIRFEAQGIQARAAHVHTCASATGALSPNGDRPGLLAAEAMGWQIENRGNGPGPNEYMAGQWIAGKPRSAWAGRTLPPVPS